MARRPARRLARPLVSASPPPGQQPPRPAPAPRPERVPVYVAVWPDGFVQIYAPRDAVKVYVGHVLAGTTPRDEALAEELAWRNGPEWVRQLLAQHGVVATGSARSCLTLQQWYLAREASALIEDLNWVASLAQQGGSNCGHGNT